MSKFAIIWDWDGTLVDNSSSAYMALQDVADAYGLPPITDNDFQNVMGQYRGSFWTSHFNENIEDAYNLFMERFAYYNSRKELKLYDGMQNALLWGRDQGIPQVVLSNMRQDMLNEECDRLHLGIYFKRLQGAGDGPKDKKPYVEQAKKALKGISYNQLVMIGDGQSDLETARNIGAISIYISKNPVMGLPYDYLVGTHMEILPILQKIIKG